MRVLEEAILAFKGCVLVVSHDRYFLDRVCDQILAFEGLLELAGWKQAKGSFPVDFSASSFPVGFISDYSEEEMTDLRAKELNQGRAAMMGLLGLMVHDKLGNVDTLLGWLN